MRFLILFLLLNISAVSAKTMFYEKEYQNHWCAQNSGITEHRLSDGARVDCVTPTHAIEFDFAHKWAESIGQALYYGKSLNKKPGVVLIMEKDSDTRYLHRLKTVCDTYGVSVWTMTPQDLPTLLQTKK